VEGSASSAGSTALRDFAREMIHRGARGFIVDLRNCLMMDSTFMGTLAGISLRLRELDEGCLWVVNLNERNAESLRSWGLDQLFQRSELRRRLTALELQSAHKPVGLTLNRRIESQDTLDLKEARFNRAKG
jgi:anti-anti-sigma regulatory factor